MVPDELSPTFNNAFTLRDRVGELTAGARAIVAGWTEPGTLVVVTHGANILPLTGVTPEEGGMVIVKPDPGSVAKLRTLGHIPPLPLGPVSEEIRPACRSLVTAGPELGLAIGTRGPP